GQGLHERRRARTRRRIAGREARRGVRAARAEEGCAAGEAVAQEVAASEHGGTPNCTGAWRDGGEPADPLDCAIVVRPRKNGSPRSGCAGSRIPRSVPERRASGEGRGTSALLISPRVYP